MFCHATSSSFLRHSFYQHYCHSAQGKYQLKVSSKEFSVFKLSRDEAANLKIDLAASRSFMSISISHKELSLIVEKSFIPNVKIEKCESGWSAIYIDSEIPFDATGVLDAVIHPLLPSKVSLLAVSTFDSDFFFFKKENEELVCSALRNAGFSVSSE